MEEMSSYHFKCIRCTARDSQEGYHFEPTDTWIFPYPEQDLIHVHFGPGATSLDVGQQEAEWNVNVVIGTILKQYPQKKFFVIIDLSRKTSVLFTPKKTMFEYKKLISHPQISEIAHYEVPLSIRAIIEIIRVLTVSKIKYHVVDSYEEVEHHYHEWSSKRHHT